MDRNGEINARGSKKTVALRKESVDRNHCLRAMREYDGVSLSARRAWIEITYVMRLPRVQVSSLSARRAWIEIPAGCWRDARRAVALRKESVDRNSIALASSRARITSLSARRAWIEMLESKQIDPSVMRRSPQGERG